MPEHSPLETTSIEAAAEAKIEFVVPDPEGGIFTTYANNVQLGFTMFDLRMIFGEIVDVQPNKILVEQRAHITISYLQAKLLLALMSQAIAKHEAQFGEIKLPPGTLDMTFTETVGKATPGNTSAPRS